MIKKIPEIIFSLIKETTTIAKDLFIILIPAIIVVKILEEAGAIDIISQLLSPTMHLFGLPGEMAIVWTTAMVTNCLLYTSPSPRDKRQSRMPSSA